MVEIVDETRRFPHVERLAGVLERLMAEQELSGREVTVVLIDDEAMALRNFADRGVDGPTDVLSYPSWEPDDIDVPMVDHLGDILVSVDTAARQAPAHGHDLLAEVTVLVAHGLTHLRGYDHQTEEAWDIFRETQGRALALLSGS